MQSDARASHFWSLRNSSNAVTEKYFTPETGGCPSGLIKPCAVKIGISTVENPNSKAAYSTRTRAGNVLRFKNCSSCVFIFHIANRLLPGHSHWSDFPHCKTQ
jgi:hypothetical protein